MAEHDSVFVAFPVVQYQQFVYNESALDDMKLRENLYDEVM